MDAPIRYARSGDVNIAYQVTGERPVRPRARPGVLLAPRDRLGAFRRTPRFLERLGSFARLICFDKRGTGLSDRGVGLPDLETRMDDVRAVMDAAGSESAALFGYSEGGPMCVLFAATYPERTRALVLYGTYAKRRDPDEDYPWAPTSRRAGPSRRRARARRGARTSISPTMAPDADSGAGRPGSSGAVARASEPGRRPRPDPDELEGRRPRAAPERPVPDARAPPHGRSRRARRRGALPRRSDIPHARFVELAGRRPRSVAVDADQILDEVEEFLTGTRPAPPPRSVC